MVFETGEIYFYCCFSYFLLLAALLPWGITWIPWVKEIITESRTRIFLVWKYYLIINTKMFRFTLPRAFHLSRIIGFSWTSLNIKKLTYPIFFKMSEIERSICMISYFVVICLQTKQWFPFICGKVFVHIIHQCLTTNSYK